jgi:hypothetical protein
VEASRRRRVTQDQPLSLDEARRRLADLRKAAGDTGLFFMPKAQRDQRKAELAQEESELTAYVRDLETRRGVGRSAPTRAEAPPTTPTPSHPVTAGPRPLPGRTLAPGTRVPGVEQLAEVAPPAPLPPGAIQAPPPAPTNESAVAEARRLMSLYRLSKDDVIYHMKQAGWPVQ